jgi:hypothetical protein
VILIEFLGTRSSRISTSRILNWVIHLDLEPLLSLGSEGGVHIVGPEVERELEAAPA